MSTAPPRWSRRLTSRRLAPLVALLPLLLGGLLNVAAQMGDFLESAIKRSLDIKDSGAILPGHGGLLDRVDSLLLVTPTYALVAMFHPFFC